MVTLSRLPNELLELCVPVDAHWYLFTGRLVCRRWQEILKGSYNIPRLELNLSICICINICRIITLLPGSLRLIRARGFGFWRGSVGFRKFIDSILVHQPTLRELDISYCSVDCNKDFSTVRLPGSLHRLSMDSLWLEDFSMLEGCTALRELVLRRTKISDVTPITGLLSLRKLDIGWTPVTNPSLLRSLTGLKELKMSFVRQGDSIAVEWLNELPELCSLTLSGSQLSRVNSSAASCRRLRFLDLTFSEISDCVFLQNMGAQLTFLGFGGNGNLLNIKPIGLYCPGLLKLELYATPIESVEDLRHCRGLQCLDISNTKVSDLGPLESLSELNRLNMIGCAANSLAPLARCLKLKVLKCSTGKVLYNFEELAECRSLKRISLTALELADLEPIRFVSDVRMNGFKIIK